MPKLPNLYQNCQTWGFGIYTSIFAKTDWSNRYTISTSYTSPVKYILIKIIDPIYLTSKYQNISVIEWKKSYFEKIWRALFDLPAS